MPSSVIIGSGGSGGGSGSNASVGVNGAVAPTSSTEIGFINGSGNEVGVSATNPLPITGTITASNPSVGLTGATAPTSATEIGVIDVSGKLQGVSASNPVRTDPTGTTLQPVSGTITANQGTSPWVVSLASTTITGTVAVTQSTSPWIVAGGGTAGTAAAGVITVQGIAAMTPLLVTATFSAPQHVIVDSGTIAVTQSTSPWVVAGGLTNNNAAPAATNVGALTALANAANPTFTEGDQVLVSIDLSGHQRVVATGAAAADTLQSGNPVLVGGVDAAGKIQELPVADAASTAPTQVLNTGGTDGVGNIESFLLSTSGSLAWQTSAAADGSSNTAATFVDSGNVAHSAPVYPFVFNGALWDRKRTPNKFFTAQVNASTTGNSAVWTPTTGKKFRLMRFQVTAQGLAATATGVVTVSFQDGTGAIGTGTYDVDVPAVANVVSGTDNISGAWIDLGNGFLSAAANNVLNFNISAAGAGTVGTYRINVAGTEE